MRYLIAFCFFIAVLSAVYVLLLSLIKGKVPVKRLDKYLDPKLCKLKGNYSKINFLNLKNIIKNVLHGAENIGNLSIFSRYRENIQAELVKAHIPLKGEEFITLGLAVSVIFSFIGAIITRNAAVICIFAVTGWFIPVFFVKSKMKKRVKVLNDQLGDTITLISNSLKAGYSFFQAVDTITTEMSGSIAEEFSQVKKEINFGITTENALENLVKRVGSEDLELVVTAILIQRQVGGNLAEILDNISDTIRHRVRIKGEIKTITAQGRMSGIIIAVIPPIIGLLMAAINPQYISLLFTKQLGMVMVGISVIMELIGIYFIRRIVKIEV